MKMIKGFVLGAAAVLAATGANAADLGSKKPAEAADYVKVCDAYGAGYFYIPGGETCLRISGYVRADYRVALKNQNDGSPTLGAALGNGWSTRAGNGTTTRVRSALNIDARTNTEAGLLRSFASVFFQHQSGGAGAVVVDRAFIQWAGLTAGRTGSFFAFPGNTGAMGMVIGNFISGVDDDAVNLLAYTASFGNGVTATVSLEDATFVRDTTSAYGGHKLPDLVANVNVAQSWGSAQLSAAVHQLYPGAAGVSSKAGWALGAGVAFNVPGMAGTSVSLEGGYSEGALGYFNATGLGVNDFNVAGGRIRASKGWFVRGGVSAAVSKQISVAADVGYASLDAFGPGGVSQALVARASAAYTATPGLTFTLGVDYLNVSKNPVAANKGDVAALGFRVQRSF